METTARPSCINSIYDIKKNLWETVYSNIIYTNSLCHYINLAFNNYGEIAVEVSLDIVDMNIEIGLIKPLSNIEINSLLSIAFNSFIDWLMYKKELTDTEYKMCKSRIDMLYSLTLNTENKAIIKL